jgi:hypothetical protein
MEESGTVADTPKKSVLNNTPFKWDNEYSFVPASQNLNDMVHCESLTD